MIVTKPSRGSLIRRSSISATITWIRSAILRTRGDAMVSSSSSGDCPDYVNGERTWTYGSVGWPSGCAGALAAAVLAATPADAAIGPLPRSGGDHRRHARCRPPARHGGRRRDRGGCRPGRRGRQRRRRRRVRRPRPRPGDRRWRCRLRRPRCRAPTPPSRPRTAADVVPRRAGPGPGSTTSWSAPGPGVNVDLGAGTALGAAGTDSVAGFDDVAGSYGRDVLRGTPGGGHPQRQLRSRRHLRAWGRRPDRGRPLARHGQRR